MSIKKTMLAVAGLAVAFSFVAVPQANAQTVEELQALINSLTAQIQALQAQIAGGVTTGGSSVGVSAFTQNLTIGSTGAEVMALQKFLNNNGYTVATVGAGSPGQESSYFGAKTQAALAAYQAANGISPAAGYFGPITRAQVNQALVTTPTPGTDDDDDDTVSGDLEGGAGDITVTERSSGVEDEVLEGEEEVKVLGFEIEADGSDVAVTSVRVEFEHDGSGSDRLDRYVDEVFVMMGDEVVGSVDVDEFSESSDVYSENVAISGAVVEEDETERFYVAVSAVNNIDSTDLSENWEVALGQIRFEDATGAILTDPTGTGVNGSISETFTFEDLSTAGDVELTVSEDDSDINDAHTVQVDSTSDTNDVEILSFTLEADGSDMTIDQLIFDITSSGAGVTEIANDFRLLMDGEEVGTVSYDLDQNNTGGQSSASSTDTAIAIIITDLDDDDVMIDEGDEVSFTLVADINDIDGAFTDGDSLSVSLSGNTTDVDAEDENGDAVTDINGSATSNDIDFSSTGLMVEVTSTPTPEGLLNTPDDNSDNQGKYVVEFEVTAFEDTAWIELDAASSTDANTDNVGVAFSMETTGDVASQSGTTTASLTRLSGGSVSGNFVRINAGQTATFRLQVWHDPASSGLYRVQMNEVGFNQTSAAAANDAKELAPAADFQSDSVQILN